MLTNNTATAGLNEISIRSVKDSNLTTDRELRDQLTVDGYKKHYGEYRPTLNTYFLRYYRPGKTGLNDVRAVSELCQS